MSKLSVVGGVTDIQSGVSRGVDLVGGIQIASSDQVVIKPNICNSKNPDGMVITDFKIIEAVVNLVKEKTDKILLVESDNISGSAEKRAKRSGFLDLCEELDVHFLNLSNESYREFEVVGETIRLPETVLEADYFINLPKIKTCVHTLVTLGIKNLYGVFQRKKKDKLHKHLDTVLPFLAEKVKSDLVIVDGINCMEGNGPVIGNHICLDLIIAGTNLVSVDSLCSQLMGFNPLEISHINECYLRGLGEIDISKVQVLGDDWVTLISQFEPPFSLKASLKSVKSVRDIFLG